MDEATIGALANLATATAADRGVMAALTQANFYLEKQLEDISTELGELKALLVNTSGKAGAQIPQLPLGNYSSPLGGDNAVCM
jgi:hypothetical protein